MIGVFAATNVFVFYVMFEVMLIPMYFLIGAFGGVRRAYAATKFFLYSLLGGLLMLASVIGLYVASEQHPAVGGTFDWVDPARRSPARSRNPPRCGSSPGSPSRSRSRRRWCRCTPGCPTPVPRRRSAPAPCWSACWTRSAPSASCGSACRCCRPRRAKLAWLIILLAVLGIVYGAIVAAGQSDLKRFVTFTSIAHFGFIALGVFAFTTQSIAGAALYMVNHGIATGLLFLVVGMLTARGGSRLIGDYGGVWKVAPILGGIFLVASLATIAMPGTNSFISEFLVLIGTFTRLPGLGDHRDRRHRAGRRLHAVDLPADDDRTRSAGLRSCWAVRTVRRCGGPARRDRRAGGAGGWSGGAPGAGDGERRDLPGAEARRSGARRRARPAHGARRAPPSGPGSAT